MCDVKNAVLLNSFIDELYFYYGHITVSKFSPVSS